MSSILTNTSAMVALQTLRSISSNLAKTQSEISTGKTVGGAKDNAAIWSISKVMESDVLGFKGISDSLALGNSTVAVAAAAAEKVTELLNDMKQKIVAAQESNVDRLKIQTDISALRGTINSIVGAAQFNGLNLLSNSHTFTGTPTVADIVAQKGLSGQVNILSSLDRSGGGVKATHIAAARGDLGTKDLTAGAIAGLTVGTAVTGTGTAIADGGSSTVTIAGENTTARGNSAVLVGDTYTVAGITGVSATMTYVARDGDTVTDVAKALIAKVNYEAAKAGVKFSAALDGVSGIKFTNNTGATASITPTFTTAMGGTAGGALNLMADLNVTTENGAKAALTAIEHLTQVAIQAAANFGTAQKRITIQQGFINSLSDSLKAGIGSLVDADMEEASARLQALQVQQQLGIQALSIANQSPQNILALFR